MVKLGIKTSRKEELIDITARVREAIKASGFKEGICFLYCPHTTCALTINENADPDVREDIVNGYRDIVSKDLQYLHTEGNSTAHIKTSLTGVGLTIFVENGEPHLGTWQGIYLCEFDGPRNREVWLKFLKG